MIARCADTNQRYHLTCQRAGADIGREQGTWMDARWGNSGQRVKAAVAVKLEPGGRLSIIEDYQMGLMRRLPDPVGIGWTVEGRQRLECRWLTSA
jgi:hypothetical protein